MTEELILHEVRTGGNFRYELLSITPDSDGDLSLKMLDPTDEGYFGYTTRQVETWLGMEVVRSAPEFLEDSWVHFVAVDQSRFLTEVETTLWEFPTESTGAVARAKIDPSTFQWAGENDTWIS